MNVLELRQIAGQAPHKGDIIVKADLDGKDTRSVISASFTNEPAQLVIQLSVPPVAIAEPAPAPTTPYPHPTAVRVIHTHKVNPVNDLVELEVIDGHGAGGAHHCYRITVPGQEPVYLNFQNGPIAANGVNGITQEILLAIVIDRLECFQAGPFACKDNEDALGMIKGGMTCLQKRTRLRMAQKVEGMNVQHLEVTPAVLADIVQAEAPALITAADVQAQVPAATPSASVDTAQAPAGVLESQPEQPAPSVAEPITEPTPPAAE